MRAHRTRTTEGPRPNRRGLAVTAALCLAALYGVEPDAAFAADVVDVRIGKHPEYTRVVFELNAPAGYRIERRSDANGKPELVVSLDATASERTVASRHPLIRNVEIVPDGRDAVARVALSQSGLQLKEMILANPPRIVLDLINPTPIAAARPEAVEVEVVEEVVVEEVVEIEPADDEPGWAVADDETPAMNDEAAWEDEETPLETAIVEAYVAQGGEGETAGAMGGEAGTPADDSGWAVAEDEAVEAGELGIAMNDEGSMGEDVRGPMLAAENRAPMVAPPVAAVPAPSETGTESAAPMFDMQTAAMAAGGVLLVALAGMMVMRRRRAASDMGDDDYGLHEQETLGGMESDALFANATEPAEKPDSEQEFDFGSSQTESASASPSSMEMGDEPVLKGAEMETPSEAPTETYNAMTDDAATQVGIGGGAGMGDDAMRVVRELEQRLATVENRFDEMVDARERLERQVAAQTEELRVQRAAIARTQRAVRNMSRPEEDAPTEPALRDPNQPPAGGPEA